MAVTTTTITTSSLAETGSHGSCEATPTKGSIALPAIPT